MGSAGKATIWARTKWFRYVGMVILALCPWLILLILTPYAYGQDLLTDEVFYFLCFAHPEDITATFSMFHIVGQPLYDLCGGDVATMRAVGIFLWMLIATATAWTTLGFVARRCGIERLDRWERVWLMLMPVAGGVTYLHWWITPSYNQFTLMGLSLFWMGILWWVEPRHVDERAWRRYMGAGAIGVTAAVVFWSKATSAILLPLFPVVALLIERHRWRVLLSPPTLVWGGVGLAAGIGLPVFYGLSFSDVFGILYRGATYQHLLKPDQYGSPIVVFIDFLRGMYNVWDHVVMSRNPFSDVFFVWFIPSVAAIMTAHWLSYGRWWTTVILGVGWLLNLIILALGFGNDYLGRWAINLICFAMLLLWIGYSLYQRRSFCIARFGLLWVIPLFTLIGVFAFGTSGNYFYKITEGAYFLFLGIAVFFLVLRKTPITVAIQRLGFPIILLSIIYITIDSLTPFAHSEPIWAMEHHLSIRGGTQTLIVGDEMARYIHRGQLMATIGGFEPDTPVIEMTGHAPGMTYILGGRAYSFPWLIGGFPGSDPAAVYILQQWEPRHLEDAWVLTVEEDGEHPLSPSVLEEVGLNFPDDYTPVGALSYPRNIEVHTLWKPNGSGR